MCDKKIERPLKDVTGVSNVINDLVFQVSGRNDFNLFNLFNRLVIVFCLFVLAGMYLGSILVDQMFFPSYQMTGDKCENSLILILKLY